MTYDISYPGRATEAEIQAMLWNKLREAGLDARLQVSCRERSCRFRPDVVVFRDGQAHVIIECKAWSPSYLRLRKYQKARNSKQIRKYEASFGLPVFLCGCTNAIEPVVKMILDRVCPES